MQRPFGRLLRQVGRVRVALEGRGAAPDLAERLILDQARDFSYIMSAIALLGLSTIALIAFDFMDNGGAGLRLTAMLATVACYSAILANSRSWLRTFAANGQAAMDYIASTSRMLALLGLAWSALLFLLVEHATPGQLNLLYAIMAGCLATPVMVSPAICAFSYWGPVSVGILVAVIASRVVDVFAVVDLLSFIGLTGFCILYLNRRMNERAIGAIRLEENAEVIKLLLRDFEESASDWLWETNAALELEPVGRRLTQVARRPAESFVGAFPAALLGPPLPEAKAGLTLERLARAVAERSPFRDLVVPVLVHGEERYWSLTGKPIVDKQGRFAGYHGVGSDITGQRRQEEQIAFLARHDSLTKLPNRVLFSETLHSACENCDTTGMALLCLDLDNFKYVNDSMGHATGDALLVAVSERIIGCLRDADLSARLGGDEFAAIVLTDDVAEALAVAQRLIERISRPFHFDGQLVQVGVSVGISLAPGDTRDPGTLMKNADLALYKAKADGRGVARLYDTEMDELLQGRRLMQAALRRAVARQEFRLMYQPIVSLTERRVVGAEALIRWQHPDRGLIGPGDFIGLAEESGLIGQIGEWVLREATATAAQWPEPVTIAVNLSPLQFRDPGLLDSILAALRESRLDPRRLELEIVESTMMDSSAQTAETLWLLHDNGVRIALDDFGTGYSSLSYLRRFPFDKIKIDRSFIRDLGYERDDSAIIQAIIGIAERMGMTVTAEGVETPEQAAMLTTFGCGQAQGYLFHRPLPNEAFTRLLTPAAPSAQVLPMSTRTGASR